MKKKTLAQWALSSLGLCCALTLNSCKDSDFDFDNIDTLLGLGGEELELPGNNTTKDITLDDFLELNNSDFVHIADNGDYELSMTDESSHATTARVEPIHLTNAITQGGSVDFDIPSVYLGGVTIPDIDIPATESELVSFEFNPAGVSTDIDELDYVGLSTAMNLTITVPSALNKVKELVLTVPDYLTLSDISINHGSASLSGNKITINNLPSGTSVLNANITGIKFDNVQGQLGDATFDSDRKFVSLSAKFMASGTINGTDINTSASGRMSIGGSISVDDINVSSATGKFHPTIDFDNLGSVNLNNIPDFLTDNQVCLDLYDPHIDIAFSSELPLDGTVSGKMNAIDAQGANMASVDIPEFVLKSGGNSVVSIRKQTAPSSADTTVVAVSNITDLIKKIPSRIDFTSIHAKGNPDKTTTIDMGRDYHVDGTYSFKCPLQFDTAAVIVYTDSMDGWNDGVKDMMFREVDGAIDGYIQVQADVESTIPVYLTVDAWGVDLNGNDISQSDLQVTVDKTIAASADGVTPVATTVTIKMQPMNNDVFKRLDGLKFRLTGSATDAAGQNAVVGKTINAYNQVLKATAVRVTKHGKVVYNAN